MKTEKDSYTKKLINLLSKKIDMDISKYDIGEMTKGMPIELEHGSANPNTDVTGDDSIETLKIVLAHLNEIPDYYTRLEKMENDAKQGKSKDEGSNKNENIMKENMSNRYKELCGLEENTAKKQLKSFSTQKQLLKEEIDTKKFDIIKFINDGLGEKKTEEEIDLYKMQTGKS
jgi:hypothetical protein